MCADNLTLLVSPDTQLQAPLGRQARYAVSSSKGTGSEVGAELGVLLVMSRTFGSIAMIVGFISSTCLGPVALQLQLETGPKVACSEPRVGQDCVPRVGQDCEPRVGHDCAIQAP